MEFSGVAPPDTSDITSNTKFTAHFNRPSAQRQSHTRPGDRERNLGRRRLYLQFQESQQRPGCGVAIL